MRDFPYAQMFALLLALFALLYVMARCLTGCSPLTQADRMAIAHDAIRIEVCQQKGRDCKADRDGGVGCFEVYDACITDAGLR